MMLELFLVTLTTLAIVLYGQARVHARQIRLNRMGQRAIPCRELVLERQRG